MYTWTTSQRKQDVLGTFWHFMWFPWFTSSKSKGPIVLGFGSLVEQKWVRLHYWYCFPLLCNHHVVYNVLVQFFFVNQQYERAFKPYIGAITWPHNHLIKVVTRACMTMSLPGQVSNTVCAAHFTIYMLGIWMYVAGLVLARGWHYKVEKFNSFLYMDRFFVLFANVAQCISRIGW